jgi:transformation/transcription domain-associated protein
MASGSGALLARGGNLQHVLGVFFRDELIAWLGRRTRGGAVSSETVKPLVAMNVSNVSLPQSRFDGRAG